jgi:integrase/recombinase XerD
MSPRKWKPPQPVATPPEPLGPPWFREVCAGYLQSLHRRRRRPRTLRTYTSELRACGRWLESEGINDAEQLTGDLVERWQDFRATVIKPGTQKLAAAVMRGALRWAAMREPPLVSPTLWLRVITVQISQLLPKPIPPRDLERIRDAIASSATSTDLMWLRSRALFLVILSSGARIWEALQLDRDQLEDRTATIIQKGGDEKLLVVSEAAVAAVADYTAARKDSCPALFVAHGRKAPDERLTYQGAYWGWNWFCSKLGIRRFTSHQIRHSCATELHRQGVDSLTIAKHLGQRGLGSIQGYAEVGLDERHQMLEVLDLRMRQRPAHLSDEELARAEAAAFAAYEALRLEGLNRAIRELTEISADARAV